ncbi:MAG: RAMP superfamily CRISPR-associated protein [Microcoleaceae cyanobacterium]
MPQEPSPWMEKLPTFDPSSDASFVEYLRWMRVPLSDQVQDSKTVNSGTILQLFERFEDNDWSDYLNRLTQRTTRLASIHFKVSCPWRIRVGGTKGPESMLLPAFDALGMPYIPSSTLRGIARAMASQDKNMSSQEVNKIFGAIEPEPSMGQVIFMDAYPLPGKEKQGGLSPDMANQIWKWKNNKPPEYDTNPNICISLEKPTFIIGLRKTKLCSDETLTQVRDYLIRGLCQGIGSRVNTGYGTLNAQGKLKEKIIRKPKIIQVDFELDGQLIHGRQYFKGWDLNRQNRWKSPGKAQAEVRPTAFRSMLRYWFRALALGVLQPALVRQLELEIFGGIEPKQHTGLFRVEVTGTVECEKSTNDEPGLLVGSLTLRHNALSIKQRKENKNKFEALQALLKTLTWLMFHLGGIGQGARRPRYKRSGDNPPWRGSHLFADPDGKDSFWNIPSNISKFQKLFRQRLTTFYDCLQAFSEKTINLNRLLTVDPQNGWAEAVDKNCEIVVCRGIVKGNKGFALSILHGQDFKIKKNDKYDYDSELCGGVGNKSIPSPVWIREFDYIEGVDFQVVTVFGAKTGKREAFLDKLQQKSGQNNFLPIFPL